METKEMIEIMNAYLDGKTIEVYNSNIKELSTFKYEDDGDLSWAWNVSDYRIKQEWYDNIPEGGIDCWVWDESDIFVKIKRVIGYSRERAYHKFNTEDSMYINAEPIKKSDFKFLEDM